MLFARVSKFYGFKYDDILEMPTDIFQGYVRSMAILRGEEMLQRLEIVTYPKLKNDKDRTAIKKHYSNMANDGHKETVSGSEMARKLKEWQTTK